MLFLPYKKWPTVWVLIILAICTILADTNPITITPEPSSHETRLAERVRLVEKHPPRELPRTYYRHWGALDDGWNVYYTTYSIIFPIQAAASALRSLFSGISLEIGPGGRSSHVLPTRHFQYILGRIYIEFYIDRGALSWNFIHQFFNMLVEIIEAGGAGTFTACLSHADADVNVYVQLGVL